ncbi:hypothetical protein GCM10028806_09240 [Spirosoma terrae]|uniref:hypothetical protein n=1 Tax=Spirosoma terrae TaxID=1968276 RepID=UPI001BAF0A1D|nr:hypothetical protein [Spirosoma terrae]
MNRFSIIYLANNQYQQISYDTQAEAESVLARLSNEQGQTPLGIYDAKTELFYWEPTRQDYYDQATIEEQGKFGNQIITIAKTLRQANNESLVADPSLSQLLSMSAAQTIS